MKVYPPAIRLTGGGVTGLVYRSLNSHYGQMGQRTDRFGLLEVFLFSIPPDRFFPYKLHLSDAAFSFSEASLEDLL